MRRIYLVQRKLLPSLVAVLAVTAAGCRVALPQATPGDAKVHEQKDVVATWNQMRLRMRALVEPMCGRIEQAADSIGAGTTDRAVQQAARQWKLDGVPAVREALFRTDPFVALSDTWVLLYQMTDYFDKGPGAAALGPAHVTAVQTCRHMEEELASVAAAATASGNIADVRAFARNWAAAHPIRSSIASRESTLNRAFEREVVNALSPAEASALLLQVADDMAMRLDIYSAQMFRQGRWEAEGLTSQVIAQLSADKVVPLAEQAAGSAGKAEATLERLAPSVEGAAGVASDLPSLLTSQREAAIGELHGELTRSLEFVRDERISAMGQITIERRAAMDDLHAMLDAERKQLTPDLDRFGDRVVDRLVERLAWLVGATLAATILAGLVLLLLARRIFFRPPRERARPAPQHLGRPLLHPPGA